LYLPNRVVDIDEYLSEHTKDLLHYSSEVASKWNRREVQTEHLLYAISDSEVIKEIYRQFKIKPQDLKNYIEEFFPKNQIKLRP